ncbi:hypothetical protein Airi01_032730 [Actinoallomurus iriomotensis]|uniref:Uncharacterized protein n=1 Tax=Actinoallomurus iriomotensis TaxID=478107 RepID=A0A9W6VQV2_9ACTN|nr:hypothetical protein Airi01_032730 [Actinoallomurus iriomotensis]
MRGGHPSRRRQQGTQRGVAERVGYSISVLLKVYAKCIEGQDETAKRRIEAALRG